MIAFIAATLEKKVCRVFSSTLESLDSPFSSKVVTASIPKMPLKNSSDPARLSSPSRTATSLAFYKEACLRSSCPHAVLCRTLKPILVGFCMTMAKGSSKVCFPGLGLAATTHASQPVLLSTKREGCHPILSQFAMPKAWKRCCSASGNFFTVWSMISFKRLFTEINTSSDRLAPEGVDSAWEGDRACKAFLRFCGDMSLSMSTLFPGDGLEVACKAQQATDSKLAS